jgi:hypothetical protein
MEMGKLVTRFADWVDSHGEGADDHMVAGMVIGAMVAGVLGVVAAVALESGPLLILGFVVFTVHMIYAMAVL